MNDALRDRVGRLLAARVVASDRAQRGYTPAQRWRVALEDGSTAFVKMAVDELTAGWLRSEHRVYAAIHADFLPALLGWDDDGERPVLALEDLAAARWPPPWRPGDTEVVHAMLDRVHATEPPAGLPPLHDIFAADGWRTVAANPGPFRSTGLASDAWLQAALPELLAAEAALPLDGDALVHLDVRSDNLCLQDGRGRLVDWNHACRGSPELDTAFFLPSLKHESGPTPEAILPDAPAAAAAVSGFFAARAGLAPVPGAPGVRPIQLAQLAPALRWVARALGLRPVEAP